MFESFCSVAETCDVRRSHKRCAARAQINNLDAPMHVLPNAGFCAPGQTQYAGRKKFSGWLINCQDSASGNSGFVREWFGIGPGELIMLMKKNAENELTTKDKG